MSSQAIVNRGIRLQPKADNWSSFTEVVSKVLESINGESLVWLLKRGGIFSQTKEEIVLVATWFGVRRGTCCMPVAIERFSGVDMNRPGFYIASLYSC